MAPKNRISPASLLEFARLLGAEGDVRAILRLVARKAAELMKADKATVFLLDEHRNELWSQVTFDQEEIRFDARLGLAGACLFSAQPIAIPDAQEDPRFHSGIDERTGYRTKTLLAVPLLSDVGRAFGVFQLLNKQGGPFDEQDQYVAQELAAYAATAIQRASTIEELLAERRKLEQENVDLRRHHASSTATEGIIGTSPQIQAVVRLIDQLRDTAVDVLVTGESGTGKELVARAIHATSRRSRQPFIALNCAALPESLLESELFGVERGVATGVVARSGKFEDSHKGTLFLDEIGDLSPGAQAKMLRVLQERSVTRVGGRQSIPVDVRIIAATNVDLERAVRAGSFRSDLYYRLKVVTIQTPALREIPQDIPLLAQAFIDRYRQQMSRNVSALSPGAKRALMRYAWPGNTRELENEMKRLVATTRTASISEEALAEHIRRGADPALAMVGAVSLKRAVEDLERRMIGEALARCGESQVRTAKLLGLSRQGLIKKLKRYGMMRGARDS